LQIQAKGESGNSERRDEREREIRDRKEG